MNDHEALMRRAMSMADTARMVARPNPWVGAVLVCRDGSSYEGATQSPGNAHAEVMAINAARTAGASTIGATLYCTLEPCSHIGRTGPCTQAIIDAGITRVIAGITDPDPRVAGSGFAALRAAGIDVVEGVCAEEIDTRLAAYLHHRRTGRPFVVLKMASTLDGRSFLPNGPRWLTGESARTQVHRLRAESDAIVVGVGTVVTDDPELTVRHVDGPSPQRIVLSRTQQVSPTARVQPCTTWSGDLEDLLDILGAQGVLQLLVEGGPTIASAFHDRNLIDRYVFHIAPMISGDEDALGVFSDTTTDFRHCTIISVTSYDNDIEVVMEPHKMKVDAL
jgi:diaminohydroxyphosphoribosylaminopyrimidine deaminase / 5-amino-6-(5-phosphoribosylamino)uracil reductase